MIRTEKNLSSIWTKAALLGSMWGSIEIIIGSFLHNLRIPLTGMILSAIGVSLLVGGQYIWKEKGLIWRAGVVCALMKSISPSAVILGPMIGIFSEAIILELFIRISRGTSYGIVLGGAITVCMPFAQSIVSLIITYGFNITTLYIEVYKIIVKNIGIGSLSVHWALGIFLSLNALLGTCAALLGIAVGKNASAGTIDYSPSINEATALSLPTVNETQLFSIPLLLLNIVSIPIILLAIGSLSLLWTLVLVGLYICVMLVLYPKAWRRFSKPKIWIEMILITIFSGFLLGEITNKQPGWNWIGIVIGVEMSLRAAFMIVAFNVVSVELRNPKIIGWVLRRRFGQLATALEVAFNTLPAMIAALGEQKNVFRHPIVSLSRLLKIAKHRLAQFNLPESNPNKIIILTGERGSGKTTLLIKLVEEFQKQNRIMGGILSPVVMHDSVRIGYDVINVQTGNRTALCRNNLEPSEPSIGDLNFLENGIRFGNDAIQLSSSSNCELIVVDEVGPLELDGKVWAQAIDRLMNLSSCPVLFVIREHLIEKVKSRWSFIPIVILKLEKNNSEEILTKLISLKTVLPIS
jgi:nucleoside-triphosphatase THEP1